MARLRAVRTSVCALAAALALATAPQTSRACDGHAYVHAELDALPAALSGMRVEIHRTMGVQLVVENPTARTLEVLDDSGVPFARIGPGGVEANLAARAWYLTYSPAAVVPAGAKPGTAARWRRASTESSFGWFESRLDASRASLPAEVIEAGRSTELGRWSVPLRVDGVDVSLAGRFVYDPPPAGGWTARLTSPQELAQGVRVRLLPGRVPGLLLTSSSARPLVVFGTDGEPFLRIGPTGVEANLHSRTWWESGRASGRRNEARTDPTATPQWRRVATAPRFSWIEPRAVGAGTEPRAWEVPIRLGDQQVLVRGETSWRPDDAGATSLTSSVFTANHGVHSVQRWPTSVFMAGSDTTPTCENP